MPSQPETSPTSTPEPATAPDPTLPASTPIPLDPDSLRVEFEPIAQNLQRPVFLTHAGDGSGRLFILEQPGRIWLWHRGELDPTPFLDITDRVNDAANEQGLLGMAFSPDFPRDLQIYVNYTDRRGDTAVSRFRVSPAQVNRAMAASEEIILAMDQPASNHNGGMLLFGPDRMLYIGTGDGGAANDRFGNGQNPASLLGKMLRIDVMAAPAGGYAIPPDNPWVNREWQGKTVRPEIWALGLRNPWRYSFDRATQDLWIADVGQNLYEEVHRVPAHSHQGLNFGWPIMEGQRCFPEQANCSTSGLDIPVADFRHGTGDCSITGGHVYRGGRTPALHGHYIVGDFCSGRIWILAPGSETDPSVWTKHLLVDTDMNISSFGEDEDGDLYVVDLEGGVYRMHFHLP